MDLFDLFQKSEWRKLQAYPRGVQQDIAYLVSLDSLIKTAVASAISQTCTTEKAGLSSAAEAFCTALAGKSLASELHLGVLATGVGKEFAKLKWAYLPPARAVSVLGILAMCEFRNSEQLIVQNDLKYSGYSNDPDEARAQYLVLVAQTADVGDLDEVKTFEDMVFLDSWSNLRKTVFQDIQLNVNSESPGLSAAIKDRFERLSQPRQETLLLLADSLSKQKPNSETAPSAPPKAAAPFNLEQSKKDHPFWYVPFPKLVTTMDKVSPHVLHFFKTLSIDDYELRRVAGAKDFVPSVVLHGLAVFDADILAYCIVVAAVMKAEPDFVRCGVWKKITQTFEKRNMAQFHLAAQAQVNGMLGDAKINLEIDDPKKSSLGLNLMQEIRKAPINYTKAPGDQQANLHLLLAGTLILRHVLNHPRYGSALSAFVIDRLASLEPVLEEFKNGELLAWDQQKELIS